MIKRIHSLYNRWRVKRLTRNRQKMKAHTFALAYSGKGESFWASKETQFGRKYNRNLIHQNFPRRVVNGQITYDVDWAQLEHRQLAWQRAHDEAAKQLGLKMVHDSIIIDSMTVADQFAKLTEELFSKYLEAK